MANAAQVKHEKHEASVVERMTAAQNLADKMFGAQSSTFAAQEIYEYLEEADEDEFAVDLAKVIGQAKLAHKTTAPTPEQVFFLFGEIWGDDD
jgi:hypothetical protein